MDGAGALNENGAGAAAGAVAGPPNANAFVSVELFDAVKENEVPVWKIRNEQKFVRLVSNAID